MAMAAATMAPARAMSRRAAWLASAVRAPARGGVGGGGVGPVSTGRSFASDRASRVTVVGMDGGPGEARLRERRRRGRGGGRLGRPWRLPPEAGGGSCRRRGEGGSGSRADGPLPNLGSCQPCDSRAYVSRVTEGFALGPRRDRPRGPRPPLGRWASAGRGGMGAAWRGRGFALGPRDRPQYSPDRRVIVSCRGARASVVSGAAGCWLEGHDRRSAGGLPPDEGGWVPLGRVGGVDGHLDR